MPSALKNCTWPVLCKLLDHRHPLKCLIWPLFSVSALPPILWSERQMSLSFVDDGYLKFCFLLSLFSDDLWEGVVGGGRVLSLCLHFKSGNFLTFVLMCNSVNISETNILSMMTGHFLRLGFIFSRCQYRWLLQYPPPRTVLRQWWCAIWTCLSPFFRSTLPHPPPEPVDTFLLHRPLTDTQKLLLFLL